MYWPIGEDVRESIKVRLCHVVMCINYLMDAMAAQ